MRPGAAALGRAGAPCPGRADPLGPDLLALFDDLAGLTADPDASLAELRARWDSDDRLRVPATVRNALRGREEPL